jgi:DNA-binding NtrC family response regulator
MSMMPNNHSNRKEYSSGASLFLRLAQSANIEEVMEDLAEVMAEKGIHLHSVIVKRGRLEREFKSPNAGAVAGRITEVAAGVEGRQTHLVVRFYEPADGAVVYEPEIAAHLAAYRIAVLAGGDGGDYQEESEVERRSVVIDGLIGESELIREVRENIAIAASLDLSVLIIGEPGTGKELVARGIHKASRRANKPFVDVNCAEFNPDLIQSKLFGHEKGAFMESRARRIGCLEQANGGTLFLDEIDDLPRQSQAMLLRVLQERKLRRVGGAEAINVDTRLIAATTYDLRREVAEGRFRRDLYDRLCGYPIQTPSLREHPTDIPILIHHYFPFVEFQEGALELLCRYGWPGNVRELISTVERLAAKAGGERIITADQARRELDAERKPALTPGAGGRFPALRDGETLMEYIYRMALAVYEQERAHLGSHSAVAHRLGMRRNTLYDWLEWARQHMTK